MNKTTITIPTKPGDKAITVSVIGGNPKFPTIRLYTFPIGEKSTTDERKAP